MNDKDKKQMDSIMRMADLIQKQAGRAVRPIRSDGYVNLLNRYGTTKDTTEQYKFEAEPTVPDETLIEFYEGNGLFAKIIDTPAEEAVKHGFELEEIKDKNIEDFCRDFYARQEVCGFCDGNLQNVNDQIHPYKHEDIP